MISPVRLLPAMVKVCAVPGVPNVVVNAVALLDVLPSIVMVGMTPTVPLNAKSFTLNVVVDAAALHA